MSRKARLSFSLKFLKSILGFLNQSLYPVFLVAMEHEDKVTNFPSSLQMPLHLLVLTPVCHANRLFHTCHDVDKAGKHRDKGTKDRNHQERHQQESQRHSCFYIKMCSKWSPGLPSVSQQYLNFCYSPSSVPVPSIACITRTESNRINHTCSKKTFPLESNPLMKMLYQISMY